MKMTLLFLIMYDSEYAHSCINHTNQSKRYNHYNSGYYYVSQLMIMYTDENCSDVLLDLQHHCQGNT